MSNIKKIAFYTQGCKLNYTETSTISREFPQDSFQIVNFKDIADIYVINSCSVTAKADKKCLEIIRQARRRNNNACIALTGCFVQLQNHENLDSYNNVDILLGSSDKFKLKKHIDDFFNNKESIKNISDINNDMTFSPSWSLGDRTRSFVKIQDGCNYYCSYCTIPYARGRSRSTSILKVLDIINHLHDNDIKEIVLTGINIGEFGKYSNESLFELLNQIEEKSKINRIRISSIEPNLINKELISFISNSKKILPHIHIPLQSGCNKILKLMQRKYDTKLFSERIDMIKELMPNSCIGTDVIVGFPGEDDSDFEETKSYLNNLPLSYYHVFSFSERPGTKAFSLSEKVPSIIIQNRSKTLQENSERKKEKFYLSNKNKEANILFESKNVDGFMFGLTENYIRVRTRYNKNNINKIIISKLNNFENGCYHITED